MDRALYEIRTGNKVEYEEAEPSYDSFDFICCRQVIEINFEEKEVGLSKNKRCSECGKMFEVTIEEYKNFDNTGYQFYEYIKKELEKDD